VRASRSRARRDRAAQRRRCALESRVESPKKDAAMSSLDAQAGAAQAHAPAAIDAVRMPDATPEKRVVPGGTR